MSDINLIILNEQNQTKFDQKIKYISDQNKHLSQLYPIHKDNLKNQEQNEQKNNNQEKKEPKIIQLPTSRDLKMARHFEKMANRITNFSKPLI